MQSIHQQAASLSLLQSWSRQIGNNLIDPCHRHSRLHAAMGYQTRSPAVDQLVKIEQLVFVVLHPQRAATSTRTIRLAGFTGARVPWGVRWGGPHGSKFDKDFSIPPTPGANGKQVDLDQSELVVLALQLHCQLQNARNRRHGASRRLRLPNLWSAFDVSDIKDLSGQGPELVAMCRRTGKRPAQLLDEYRREHLGFCLLPLNWVSHRWLSFAAIYADLARFPKRQVIRLRRPATDLQGFRGAAEFDFYHSRFGRRQTSPRRRRRSCRAARCVA